MFSNQFLNLPELETDRLLLRKLTLADAEAIFDYARLPRVAAFTLWPHHRSLEDTHEFLARRTAGYAQGQVRDWAIVRKSDQAMIGTGGFVRYDPANGTGEIGCALHPKVWRQGYANEMVRKFVDWGFQFEDLRRIVAHCIPSNVASIKLLENNGFRRDGTLRGALRREGISVDLHEYCRLRSETVNLRLRLRQGTANDRAAVEAITLQAFQHDPVTGAPIDGIEPPELPLVRALFDEGAVTALHVAEFDKTIVGYIIYSTGKCEASDAHVVGLTIMGVHPLVQRRGWGTKLLLWSVEQMRGSCDVLIVLGHPQFYPKAGFRPVHELGLRFAITAPKEACMALFCSSKAPTAGVLEYHPVVGRFG
jgi:[ribosomal protein S5]-alanine N-acetyltransferase